MFQLQQKGRRLVLTLDRPPVNAINDEWLTQFHRILTDLEQSSEFAVLHIRSAQKIFCAGMDVAHIQALAARPDGADAMVADVTEFQRAFARIEAMPQVVLAEIGGAALGGGLELALACDLRIAARHAKIGLPEARLGLIPGAGGTQRLTRLCGRGIASRLILSAEVLDGAAAERLGVVQWSFDKEELPASAEAIATRIADLSPESGREAKRLIAAALDPTRDGYAEEREADRRLFGSPDTQSRIGQFLAGAR
jgi:enoyl-CoA hydratase/carnithine racemase